MAFPLLAVLIWSGNTIVSKLAATAIEPGAIAFYRVLIAASVMSPFLLLRIWKDRQIIKDHLWQLAVLALLGMVAYQGCIYLAAQSTSAMNMGIIVAIMPLVSAVLSSLLGVEVFTVGALLGGVLSVVGIAILIGRGHPLILLKNGIHLGDALVLISTVSYAAYTVLLRHWAVRLSIWQLIYVLTMIAVVFTLPWYLLSPPSPITGKNLPLMLYAALPASLLAPYLWMLGIRFIGPNRASLFMNLAPVFIVLIAALLLHEPLHGYHVIGGAMALVGVWLGHTIRHPLRQKVS